MSGPAGVTALVLAETVAGGLALVFVTPLWNEVRRGFFVLTCSILALFSAAVWGSVSAGRVTGDDAGTWSLRLAFALTFVLLAVVVLLLVRRGTWARFVGYAAAPLAVGMLGAIAGTADGSWLVAFLQLLAGAAFLGAVLDGLLLGHWYLTDRGLSRAPIDRATTILIAGVAVEAVAVISSGFSGVGESADFNPLLTAGALAPWIALGMVAVTALVAGFVRATLKGARASAVQAATGFFYLAVVTAFTAEVAVKTRFLPR